jgi:hypothetical protein
MPTLFATNGVAPVQTDFRGTVRAQVFNPIGFVHIYTCRRCSDVGCAWFEALLAHFSSLSSLMLDGPATDIFIWDRSRTDL